MIIIAMARLLVILLSAVLGSVSLASGSRWIGECATQHGNPQVHVLGSV